MHTIKLTKIVATIGPASETEEKLEQLLDAGVNIFRFNTKHSTPEWHDEHINLLQKVADRKGVTIGILLDLQGPEIRLETKDKKDIPVISGQELRIGLSYVGDIQVIIPHAVVFKLLKAGNDLLVDDGFVETEVIEVTDTSILVKIKNDAVIKHRKGVNLPGIDVDFPSLIDNDIRQLDKNARNKVDFIGLSFVRSARDIRLLRAEMEKRNIRAQIIAKIESQPALDRIDEIIKETDVVMVARGDLGVEVPIEQLAYWQKTIIDKCRIMNKPVITATQMLESMILNPRPTRAEATDVAHAIYDGTDAIMLSGESAGGKWPVRAVETMVKIAKWNEQHSPIDAIEFDDSDPTSSVTRAAVSIVRSSIKPPIDTVIVFTETGHTARTIARYHLHIPVIAVTDNTKIAESLSISYGVIPILIEFAKDRVSTPEKVLNDLLKSKVLHKGETVIVVYDAHPEKMSLTTALQIITV